MKERQKVKRITDRHLPLKLKILGNRIQQYLTNHDMKEEDIPGLYSIELDLMLMRVMMVDIRKEYEEGLLTLDQYLVHNETVQSNISMILHYKAKSSKLVLERLAPIKAVKEEQKMVLKFIEISKQVAADEGVPRGCIVFETIERMREQILGREKRVGD